MSAREHPSLPFVFRLIEDAAARNVRCPTNDQIAQAMYRAKRKGWECADELVSSLIESGQVSIKPRNSMDRRVATILVGPHAGKSTADGRQASPWTIEELERRGKEVQTW